MAIGTLLAGIVQSTAGRLLTKALENPAKRIFNPDKTYNNRLSELIRDTIEQFEKDCPIETDGKKFPFYHAQDLFLILSEHVLFETQSIPDLAAAYQKYPRIIPATQEEIEKFYSIFVEKVNRDKELSKLFADSNYKQKIVEIFTQIKTIATDVSAIREIVELTRSDASELVPIVIDEFVDRKELSRLSGIIQSQNVLLLSGISFCGKSQIAKKLAQEVVSNGHKFGSSDEISDASRFLKNVTDKRIFLLEDPFGHDSSSENMSHVRKLRELTQNLSTTCKLIVTSRIEILRSVFGVSSIDDCSVGRWKWIDLTNSDSEFLLRVWGELCIRNNPPVFVRDAISNYLKSAIPSQNLIQVGQLTHLANIPSEKLTGKNLESLLHLARADSKDISIEVQNRGDISFELFIALGLGATTTAAIRLEELNFVLTDSELQPGFINKEAQKLRSYTFEDRRSVPESAFPEYETLDALANPVLQELSFFQHRGFITIVNRRVLFMHPTYREAARYLLLSNSILIEAAAIKILKRIIVSLDPNSILNCVKQFEFIHRNSSSEDVKNTVQECAFLASRYSIFPGVRDKCFSFLLGILPNLHSDKQDEILYRLQRKSTSSDVLWHGDIPYISPGSTAGIFDHLRRSVDQSENEQTLNRLNSGEHVALSKIWDFILALQKREFSTFPNSVGMKYILNCDEVFVRQKIAHLILIRSCAIDEEILKTIFEDDHPSVIFEGLKGAVLSFAQNPKAWQTTVRSFLIKSISNPLVAVRGNNLISTFGIDYGSESIHWRGISERDKKIIWALWAELFPIFLRSIPDGIKFPDSGRFGATLDDSAQFISAKAGIAICEEYYKWLERYLQTSVPDTHVFGLLPYLLDVTNKSTKGRFSLFKKIINHSDTNFATYSLHWCLSYWNDLTKNEKEFVIKTIISKRLDKRWLQATALTSGSVPLEIVEEILGDKLFLEKEISDLVKKMPSQLLHDCLTVFLSHSYQIAHLGLGHAHGAIWEKVKDWILINQFQIGFEICLREYIGHGVNGYISHIKFEIWESLCVNYMDKKLLTERLITETAQSSCNLDSAKKLWDTLILGYAKSEGLNVISDIIVKNIVRLQMYHPEDLFEFFENDFIQNYLLKRMPSDDAVIHVLWLAQEGKIDNDDLCKRVEVLIENNHLTSIQLNFTFRFYDRVLKKCSNNYPCLQKLVGITNPIMFDFETKWKEFDEDVKLSDWFSMHSPNSDS